MLARRIYLLLSALVLLLVGVAVVEAQGWTKYAYDADGFEVEFSGKVKVDPTAVDAETQSRIFRATNYLQEGADYAFIVAASLQRVPVNFENGVEKSMGALKCTKTISDKTLPFASGRAREVRATSCVGGQFSADARYFTQGSWFYQVLALHPASGARNADARRFVESFRVTGPGKQ
jgi:hypothetical protein